MKIVINNKYGGYALSEQAVYKLAELGHPIAIEAIELYKYYLAQGLYHCNQIPRHDPLLVQVVEELGEKANGPCANLIVKEIKIGYNIEEFDGLENVTENNYYFVIDI